MLSPIAMGWVALSLFWITTALVGWSAARELAALVRRLGVLTRAARAESGFRLVRARVLAEARAFEGGAGDLAEARVRQTAHRTRAALRFGDQSRCDVSFGGLVEVDHRLVEVAAGPAAVWPRAEAVRIAAACPSPVVLAEAWADAGRARGWARDLVVTVRAGETVWIAGAFVTRGDQPRIEPDAAEGLLITQVDPRLWLAGRAALAFVAIAAMLATGVGCTVLVLVPPLFGPLSTLGGLLSLAFFLLVQPFGTALRDAVRLPSRALLHGVWRHV
jgi:hypothetical protein